MPAEEITGAEIGWGRRPVVTAAHWTQSSQSTPDPEGGGSPGFLPVKSGSNAMRTIIKVRTRWNRVLCAGTGGQSAVTGRRTDFAILPRTAGASRFTGRFPLFIR